MFDSDEKLSKQQFSVFQGGASDANIGKEKQDDEEIGSKIRISCIKCGKSIILCSKPFGNQNSNYGDKEINFCENSGFDSEMNKLIAMNKVFQVKEKMGYLFHSLVSLVANEKSEMEGSEIPSCSYFSICQNTPIGIQKLGLNEKNVKEIIRFFITQRTTANIVENLVAQAKKKQETSSPQGFFVLFVFFSKKYSNFFFWSRRKQTLGKKELKFRRPHY